MRHRNLWIRLLLSVSLAQALAAAEPDTKTPDYKSLFERANHAAAAWKAKAEQSDAQNKKLLEAIHDLQLKIDDLKTRYQMAKAGPQWAAPAAQEVSVATVRTEPGGMPQEVAAGIRSKAQSEWPGDYRMQQVEIERQTKAYQQLQQR